MLKIKDNVDLKDLEKFGFKYKDKTIEEDIIHPYYQNEDVYISVEKTKCYNKRELLFDGRNYWDIPSVPNVIFDLIQAGLVEKVGE
jgi:hypothetical protein